MKRKALIIAALAAVAASAGGSERYLWPLDQERKLSSTFAEYRDGHYHAGIDLRTFGQVGLPCRAIDDCEAVRLRVQPAGYGKALYVRTAEGHQAVYAHVDGFCRPLDSLAYHWRDARGKNSCDIDIAPGAFTFRRGDIVAYTGSTGSLHPHLHFEMREADGRPFNPLETFFSVPDASPPVIAGLSVVPRRWGSLVDGSPLARTARFRLLSGSLYAVADTFELDGEFGFAVRAYDTQILGSYRMGWFETELLIDGAAVYRARNSSFDYAQFNDVDIEYEERGGEAPGRYLTLFRKPANGMGGREGNGAVSAAGRRSGITHLEPGFHRGEVIVRDASGNAARGAFYFFLRDPGAASPPAPEPARAAWSDSFACDFQHELRAEGLYLRLRIPVPLASPPAVSLLGDTARSPLGVLPLGAGEYVTLVRPARFRGGAGTFRVRAVDGRGRSHERFKSYRVLAFETGSRLPLTAGDGIVLSIETAAVRGISLMIVREDQGPPAAAQEGLVPLAAPFALEFAPEGFASYPRCSFEAGRRAGLYRLDADGGWSCVGVPAAQRRALDIRRPGTYAVMADVGAPVIGALAFTRKHSPSGYFKGKLYYVSVQEEGSGVEAESAAAYLDGRRVVCEWDGYRRRLMVPIPRSHPRGPSTLRFEVTDRAGNSGSAEYSVMIE